MEARHSETGRPMASYSFGAPEAIEGHKFEGRKVIPKEFKRSLVETVGLICELSGEAYE